MRALLIAGRSGVGKSTVSYEVSELLRQHDVAHALVDGDNLDAVHPSVEGSSLAEANLRAIWSNYRALGHDRMIYVNTVSVLESEMIRRAIGKDAEISGILLTASDDTAGERLRTREIGSTLDVHIERSAAAAGFLEDAAPDWVHRVPTDGRSVTEIAASILRLTGWLDG
ncbi:MAG TPA: adenylyl-sulfate kinase [Thermomicrobiales bacterium]|nr:adenylyl-sulfate kinase [Thermomicrobiales bacterium]